MSAETSRETLSSGTVGAVSRKSTWARIAGWFDPRQRRAGTWAFSLNRITALGLTLYLFIHLVVLSQLASGPAAYDNFVRLAKSPLFIAGELLVVMAGIIHGLNGIRLVLTTLGVGVPYQKTLFWGLLLLALAISLIFGIRMFTA